MKAVTGALPYNMYILGTKIKYILGTKMFLEDTSMDPFGKSN